jgi:hypothetical protein
MNLYGNSRFIIDAENIELKEIESPKGDYGAIETTLKIVAYDKNNNSFELIAQHSFAFKTKEETRKKYLLKIMDSISEDYMNGYNIPDFSGLVVKAINDVKEADKKK